MRKLGLHLLELLLGAKTLRNVDGTDKAYLEIIDGADPSCRKENVDDAAVPRDHPRLFFEIRLAAITGFHGPPERIGTFLPGIGHGTSDIVVDAASEHLDGPFVGFLKRERVHAGPQEPGMAVEIGAEVLDALGF
ncbi:hypothetical protein SAMN05443254_11439 [Bradyrhizobium sp. OK095]|nr:hypothetical protein SAMN05443254_11439 [Bradyrhizobium sp. OK095]